MPTTGTIITRQEAEDEIGRFLNVRQESLALIVAAVGALSPEAQAHFSSERISFVFEKSLIEKIMNDAGNNCNGLRFYLAAQSGGSPTLVTVPCQITPDPNFRVQNIVPSNMGDDAALQFPSRVTRAVNNTDADLANDTITSAD